MQNRAQTQRGFLMTVATISSLIYIGWRIFFTIPTQHGMVSFVAGLALVLAETVGVIEAFSHYRNMSQSYEPSLPVIPQEWYPDVDVLICTHSESVELLYKTLNGCIHLNYPDRSKVHIYLCDDSNRPEMAKLAEEMGVGYFGLSGNKTAKAGNLNNALSKTNSPLIVTFDADMIPTQNFLLETVPYFSLPKMIQENDIWRMRTEEELDENYKIGFIQTPQSFYNTDLFQYNLFAERNIPNEQDYFFREINVGRNRSNSAIYAGSNTVISRAALEEVGGIRSDTITEDFATGIDIQAKGYSCYAISKALAHGLAPSDFKSLVKQRQRWGRGCVQTLRRVNFLFGKIPIKVKMSYISCFLYWWTFLRRFIYILSPILFTVFGIVVVECSLWELLLIWLPSYVIYNRALKVLSGNIRNQTWSNIVDTIIFPYMIIPVFAETVGLKLRKFVITPKERISSKNAGIRYAIPHLLLVAANCVGLYRCISDMITYRSLGGVVLLYWLILNLYFLLMAIIFMVGRVNFRTSERFYAVVDVSLMAADKTMQGKTSDLSEGGFAVMLGGPEYIPYDQATKVRLRYLNYEAEVDASVMQVEQQGNSWKYSFKITDVTEENKRSYLQIVFDRSHTLPNIIRSNVVQDVAGATKGHRQKRVRSNRKLPRITLRQPVELLGGGTVTIVN